MFNACLSNEFIYRFIVGVYVCVWYQIGWYSGWKGWVTEEIANWEKERVSYLGLLFFNVSVHIVKIFTILMK